MIRKVDDLGRLVIPIEWRRLIGLGEPGAEAFIRQTADGRGVEIRAAHPADGEPRFTEQEMLAMVARAAARVVPDQQTALGAALAAEVRRLVPGAGDET